MKNVAERIALGTAQFGLNYGVANSTGQVNEAEGGSILSAARSLGIDTLDTAIAYGDSENLLGALGLTGWKVITKLPLMPSEVVDARSVYDWVFSQAAMSRKRLGLERVHGVLLHRPEQLLGTYGQALYQALQELKTHGFAENIGISIYRPEELSALEGKCRFDLVQAPLNIVDRRLVQTGWLNRLNENDIRVHVRSAFLQGLLLMSASERPDKFSRWDAVWAEWHRWLGHSKLTPLQACLQYLFSLSGIDRIVVGVDTLAQLNEIVNAANGSLTSLPDFGVLKDERLINPASWSQL